MESVIIFFIGLIVGGSIILLFRFVKRETEKPFVTENIDFKNFPFGVLIYKMDDKRISYINDIALGFFGGLLSSQVVGKVREDLLKYEKQHKDCYADERVIEFDTKNRHYIKKFFIQPNNSDCYEILFDITEYKINESQLKKAQELSEKANRTKSLFLASMSHEIRTPMNAIIGISNMLLRYKNKNLTKKQTEGIGLINSSGDRLLNLINEILDLSKIESGKMVLNKKEILLSNLFSQLKVLVYSLIAKKEISFHINSSNTLPERVYVDGNKLNQVLVNILGNAVKFTQKGSVVLNAHLKNNKLVFEVTDTGIGIESKDLPYIFDEFKQLRYSNTQLEQDNNGTGLGLALCKRIVTLMGGEILAESELGKGTTIKFSIPLEKQNESLKINHKREKYKPCLEKSDAQPNVLVIDKDLDAFYLLENYIRPYKCNIYHASSSSVGLQMIKGIDPKVIFLELDMPKYSGYDILRRLKKDENKSRWIVVHSSVLCPSKEKYCFHEYLKKPVEENELKSLLDETFAQVIKTEKKRILLVEDDDSSAYTIRLMLESMYDLFFAKDGKQGVEKFIQDKPDLVLMDIKMPVLDGVECLKEIKKIDIKTPILALTAKVMPFEKLEIISAGFDDFIAKPVVQEKLINSIEQYLCAINSNDG